MRIATNEAEKKSQLVLTESEGLLLITSISRQLIEGPGKGIVVMNGDVQVEIVVDNELHALLKEAQR